MSNGKEVFICQWQIKVVYGKQRQALEIMKRWGEEKLKTSNFKLSKNRVMTGYIGESPSLIIDEYEFGSMKDFEEALSDMSNPEFVRYSEELAPYIVPSSQKWIIFKTMC